MGSNCINFELEKLFAAFNLLISNDKRRILDELNKLNEICKISFSIMNYQTINYTKIYRCMCMEKVNYDLPILYKFFAEVKEISDEAYNFITDGYDILNLKEFLAFDNYSYPDIMKIGSGIYRYSQYFSYFIEKILNEKNEKKQHMMLRALVGI